jgi:hypothetical protein
MKAKRRYKTTLKEAGDPFFEDHDFIFDSRLFGFALQ